MFRDPRDLWESWLVFLEGSEFRGNSHIPASQNVAASMGERCQPLDSNALVKRNHHCLGASANPNTPLGTRAKLPSRIGMLGRVFMLVLVT